MLTPRPSAERGHIQFEWLDTHHTFSFGDYYDSKHMGFRALRVINEDHVAPGTGFGMHPHRDMEIITYLLDGELAHKDNMGNGSVIRPGEVQRMTAGTGIMHSEHNASQAHEVHLLQIWIEPAERGLKPSYEQKAFPLVERHGALQLVAAQDARDGAVSVHQDVSLYAGRLETGEHARLELRPGRAGWVQIARGAVTVNGKPFRAGDGVALENEPAIEIAATAPAEVLVFDLA